MNQLDQIQKIEKLEKENIILKNRIQILENIVSQKCLQKDLETVRYIMSFVRSNL